jgi:hypothetical protein
MQRKHAPSQNKRKQPEPNTVKEKGKEKEPFCTVPIPTDSQYDLACNEALDQFAEKVAALDRDEVMSEGPESEGESEEFVPETPLPVERPAKKVCRRLTNSSTDLDQSRHAPFDLTLSLYS